MDTILVLKVVKVMIVAGAAVYVAGQVRKPDRFAGRAASGPGDFSWHEVSPDGQKVAVQTLDTAAANYQIGVYDLLRGTNTRITFGRWRNQSPIWSPDSQTVAYGANQKGRNNMLFQRKSGGTGGEQLLTESANNKFPTSWSADGRFIVQLDPRREIQLGAVDFAAPCDRKPFPFLETHSNVAEGRFCPRGEWIAYSSDESGRSEVYVTSFPGHQGKWQVSQTGGSMPRWRRDGKELFYLAPNGHLMAADVNWSGTALEIAAVHSLFGLRLAPGPPIYDLGPTAGQIGYDVSPDGQRVLVNSPAETDVTPITVILNWTPKLNK